jgi:Ca-activated chloride channel homolog
VRLLTPAGLWAAAALVPLVTWYLLRPRRRRVPVGSTYLWRALDRPATAATPWQRFRGDATFWLTALALLALAAAFARPAVPVPVALGDHTILVLDTSGSMLAVEDGTTRAEQARRAATELTSSLGPGQRVSLVSAGPRARIELAASGDPREVARSLAAVTTTHAPADLVDAFTLATSLQRPGERTVVHLLTDRDLTTEARAAAPPGLAITGIGSDRPNVAVTRLSAAAAGAGDHRILAQVRNFATAPARGRLLVAVDGLTLLEAPLELAPRATEDVVATVPGTDGQVLSVHLALEPNEDGEVVDALAHDDQASLVLTAPRELAVLVAGPGSRFVEGALAASPGLRVETAPAVPTDLTGIDLLVVDRVAAPAELTVPTLLLGPTSWPDGIAASGTATQPSLTYQATQHALLADVDLTGLGVAEAVQLDAPALTPLAAGPDGSLLAAGRLGGVPVVVLPFDLTASDLPLRPAWPLLVANAASWAVGGDVGSEVVTVGTTVTPDLDTPSSSGASGTTGTPGTTGSAGAAGAAAGGGQRLVAHPPDGAPSFAIGRADGRPASFLVDRTGMWRVEAADGTEVLLPVLAAAEEGDLVAPRPASSATPLASSTADGTTGLFELSRWAVTVALVLLLAEWLWSQAVVTRRRRAGQGVG